jgi:hypothetical protein
MGFKSGRHREFGHLAGTEGRISPRQRLSREGQRKLAGGETTGEGQYQPMRPGGAQDPTARVRGSSRALPGRVDHGHPLPVISSPANILCPSGTKQALRARAFGPPAACCRHPRRKQASTLQTRARAKGVHVLDYRDPASWNNSWANSI